MHKERACCEFLAFEMHQEPDEVWLAITAPEDARATADALFEPFLPTQVAAIRVVDNGAGEDLAFGVVSARNRSRSRSRRVK